MKTTLDAGRIMERVLDNLTPGDVPAHKPDLGSCTGWRGPESDGGYAILWIGKKKLFVAHWLYEQEHGPIPAGLEPDHLCHDPDYCEPGPACPHRRCTVLAHLEAVTRRENTVRSGAPPGINARKVVCDYGDDLTDDDNVYVRPSRPHERECVKCRERRRDKLARTQRALAHIAMKKAGQMSLLD
ncbi:hypothetical protein GCM10022252_75890 [Streptosporangium oxazolinicum]|uniref:HNH nuclease domain-containing protein n=1 Tax=Streptosporangium oxazolinicum TaxID=909287 RepID=A0ABP8BLL5_9ACTN